MRHERMKALLVAIGLVVCVAAPSALGIPTEGLIAWWPFQGNANDASGNGHDGTVYGATLTQDRFGNPNSAYRFNGNDRIVVPDSADFTLGANDFTILTWMQYSPIGSYYLMGHDEGPGERNKWIFWITSSGFFLHVNGPSFAGYSAVSYSGVPVQADQWYQMAVRREGDLYTLFWDGLPVASRTEFRAIPNPNASFQMGTAEADHPERVFRGVLDDVLWYNRPLSDDEIKALYDWKPNYIPAPSAVVLAALGVSLVNWLRRRRVL